jgi:hypothetical protein
VDFLFEAETLHLKVYMYTKSQCDSQLTELHNDGSFNREYVLMQSNRDRDFILVLFVLQYQST